MDLKLYVNNSDGTCVCGYRKKKLNILYKSQLRTLKYKKNTKSLCVHSFGINGDKKAKNLYVCTKQHVCFFSFFKSGKT